MWGMGKLVAYPWPKHVFPIRYIEYGFPYSCVLHAIVSFDLPGVSWKMYTFRDYDKHVVVSRQWNINEIASWCLKYQIAVGI